MKRAHRLVVETAGGTISEYVVRQERVSIGRDAACDLVLESEFVSRLHATLECRDSDLSVADQESRNGVSVNGRRIAKEHRLAPGDKVEIGDYVLQYVQRIGAAESTKLFLGTQGSRSGHDAFFVDVGTWEVWVEGKQVATKLSLQEFTFLRLLFEAGENVCTREQIGEAIWGEDKYDFNMLHRLVHRVKEKVEPQPKKPRYIEVVPRVGYKLRIGLKTRQSNPGEAPPVSDL